MNKIQIEGSVYYELKTRGYMGSNHDEYLHISTGTIVYEPDHNERKSIIIGEFSYYYMDIVPLNIFDSFDAEEQYMADMASDMVDDDGEFKKDFSFMEYVNSLILLNTVKINEEYRGQGIMKGLIEFFRSYHESSTIILKAHPTNFDDIKKKYTVKEFNLAQSKVIKSYEKCGFKRVNKKSPYMYNEGGTIIP